MQQLDNIECFESNVGKEAAASKYLPFSEHISTSSKKYVYTYLPCL